MGKICIKCNVEKEINSDNFTKDKKCSDGYRNVCRECCNSRERELHKIGSLRVDKKKERMRQYMKKKRKDPEFNKSEKKKERERNKERRKNDPEYRKKINNRVSKRRKERRDADPEYRKKINNRISKRKKEKLENDPEYRKKIKKINKKKYERRKEKMENDPEYRKKINNRISKRKKERMKTDPVYRFKIKIRKRIRRILKDRGYTKKSKTHEILGISYEEFNLHMERQFVKGMTWDNYGEWHIDHIIPLATAICEDDVIRLNHYTNLQPLWAEDNLRKGSKIL